MSAPPRAIDLGGVGAVTAIMLAAALAVFLFAATHSPADGVPRPLLLGALFATPGVIGLLGVRSGQRSLRVAAGVCLLLGSFIAFSGVTLVFLVPGVLLLASAAIEAGARRPSVRLGGVIAGVAIVGLVLGGGWAALFGLTRAACVAVPDGQTCSSAALTVSGAVVAAACLGAALVIAWWSARQVARTL